MKKVSFQAAKVGGQGENEKCKIGNKTGQNKMWKNPIKCVSLVPFSEDLRGMSAHQQVIRRMKQLTNF